MAIGAFAWGLFVALSYEGRKVKALVKERPEPGLSLKDVDAPTIQHEDDVLFEVEACAICTGELKVYDWGAWAASDKTIQLPTILGHEATGVVCEVGASVKGLKPGDRIAVDPIMGCGVCALCMKGAYHMCPHREIYGKKRGAFADYAVLPMRACCPLPDDLTFEQGAMLENFGIAVHAVEGFLHAPGDVAVVIGAGPIGIMAAQVLAVWGLRVVMTDLVPFRLHLAEQLVDGVVVTGEKTKVLDLVAELSQGHGADFVLEAGATQSALDLAFEVAKNCGTVVTIGTFDEDLRVNPFFSMTRREITLVSRMGRTHATWQRMTRLLNTGKFDLQPFVSHILPFESYAQGFNLAKTSQTMKVVLKP
jgi:threonine 3-dehydrogenase